MRLPGGSIVEATFENIYKARETLNDLIVAKWFAEDVFSPQWWGILGVIVLSYIVVFSLLDKSRFTQLLLFGALMAVTITTYDLFGANFGLWAYKVRLLPVIPGIFLYDYTVIPLYYMLIYQYSPNWKSFLLWDAAFAAFIGLVFFPTLVATEIIFYGNWLPIYQAAAPFLFGILNRAIVLGTLQAEKRRLGYAPSALGVMLPRPAMKPQDEKESGQEEAEK